MKSPYKLLAVFSGRPFRFQRSRRRFPSGVRHQHRHEPLSAVSTAGRSQGRDPRSNQPMSIVKPLGYFQSDFGKQSAATIVCAQIFAILRSHHGAPSAPVRVDLRVRADRRKRAGVTSASNPRQGFESPWGRYPSRALRNQRPLSRSSDFEGDSSTGRSSMPSALGLLIAWNS